MELLCIETHIRKYVIAGNTYKIDDVQTLCKCGPIYNTGVNEYYPQELGKCSGCGTIIPTAALKNKGWAIHTLFVEIGTQDEHSTYEKKEQLIEKL